jgi:hypothetical protein
MGALRHELCGSFDQCDPAIIPEVTAIERVSTGCTFLHPKGATHCSRSAGDAVETDSGTKNEVVETRALYATPAVSLYVIDTYVVD